MTGLAKVVALLLLTLLLCVATTAFQPDSWTSVGTLMGYPIVQCAQEDARGLIAIGQVNAAGVVVIAQAGYGLIAFAQVGAGVLFGIGQGMGGLVTFGQLSLGLFFALGQLALSIQGLGQVAIFSRSWFTEMSQELTELLKFRFEGNTLPESKVTTKHDPSVRHQPSDRWPASLLGTLRRPDAPRTMVLGEHHIRVEYDRITIQTPSGEVVHQIEDSDGGVVQLSYSQHARRLGWLWRLLGGSPVEHRLHAELRHRSGLRVGGHAVVPAESIEGLPLLEQSGPRMEGDALLELLAVASALELRVAHNPATRVVIQRQTLPLKVRLFHLLKWALRPAVIAIHLFPLALLPKVGLRLMEMHTINDGITVSYVALLVYFFTILALLALLYPLVGPASKRTALDS